MTTPNSHDFSEPPPPRLEAAEANFFLSATRGSRPVADGLTPCAAGAFHPGIQPS